MASVFYGSDTACISDVAFVDVLVTDPIQIVGQRVARRLQTPRGALALIGDDPNYGWDVRQYLNGRMSPADVSRAQQQIQAECTKDEQVQSATATMTFSASTGVLSVAIQLIASVGPFTLTLSVSQLTTTAIFSSF